MATKLSVEEKITLTDTVSAKVKQGSEGWTYIYIFLALSLTIEGTIIQMITPLPWPFNLMTYAAVSVITGWLFIFSGWFQKKLIGFKISSEDVFR